VKNELLKTPKSSTAASSSGKKGKAKAKKRTEQKPNEKPAKSETEQLMEGSSGQSLYTGTFLTILKGASALAMLPTAKADDRMS
jgi:hypothetical protein